MVKRGEENCLSDNRWSAVQCQGAKRNPGMAQASKLAIPVTSTEEKPASAVAAAIKNAAEGGLTLLSTGTLQQTLHHQHLFSGADVPCVAAMLGPFFPKCFAGWI